MADELSMTIEDLEKMAQSFKREIKKDRFLRTQIGIIINIKTTGLHVEDDEIIEIAALKFNTGKYTLIDSISTLIKTDKVISKNILSTMGLRKEEFDKKSIKIKEGLIKLITFCQDYDIYPHYQIFVQKFIRYALAINDLTFSLTNWIDTIDIFRHKWPKQVRFNLSSLLFDHQIKQSPVDRGLDNAKNILKLLQLTIDEGQK